ncbi:DEAD/DEAH box helicase [Gordonia amicalis]|uniref:DEAD/DEAH box helicase n=1 Tax=Gordonia amicalis TaxID=89053 RepID=UPI00200A8FB1|nr:DEAD/DEAH box helicase [Gordonia amicalis]UPW14572.1 DEAD/DEAH box helicase [Gordonia amicalis]
MAPGFGLKATLQRANEAVLIRLLDPAVVALSRSAAGVSPNAKTLVDLVLATRGRHALLIDPQARSEILALLPADKLDELTELLGLPSRHHDSVGSLQISPGTQAEADLLGFFGVPSHPENRGKNSSIINEQRCIPNYALFEHQRDVARRAYKKTQTDARRTILHMPTGAGKTRTAMHLLCDHLRNSEPAVVIWLAYNRELLQQAADEFERAWSVLGNRELSIARFWGSSTVNPLSVTDGLIVAGYNKLYNWWRNDMNLLPILGDSVSYIVVDEAHQATARTYSTIIEQLADKRPDTGLLGLTATPGRTWADREEDRLLANMFRGVKVGLEIPGSPNPVDFLIEKEYLARPHFRTIDIGLTATARNDEDIARQQLIGEEKIREDLSENTSWNLTVLNEIEGLVQHHRRVMLFGTTVSQSRTIAAVLNSRGYTAFHVDANSSTFDRAKIIQRYTSVTDEPMVLCNYGVLTTGFDAPQTSAAVIARPTRSLVLYSQMVGRAIRGPRAGGNETAEIVTVVDTRLPGFGNVSEAFVNWEDVWPTTA